MFVYEVLYLKLHKIPQDKGKKFENNIQAQTEPTQLSQTTSKVQEQCSSLKKMIFCVKLESSPSPEDVGNKSSKESESSRGVVSHKQVQSNDVNMIEKRAADFRKFKVTTKLSICKHAKH